MYSVYVYVCVRQPRFLSYLYICLSGSYSGENRIAQALKEKVRVPVPNRDDLEQSMPTAKGADTVSAMRACTKNQLEIATLMYGDDENKFRQRAIHHIGAPCAHWQGEQSRRNRSAEESASWEQEPIIPWGSELTSLDSNAKDTNAIL